MRMLRFTVLSLGLAALVAALPALASAEKISAEVFLTTQEGKGAKVGKAIFTDKKDGLEIKVNFQGLPPGLRGFHVHENPDCSPTSKDGKVTLAGAAGGHFDPHKAGKHLGPGSGGHLGDLPAITVGADGTVKTKLYLKGVKAAEFMNRSLMIHAGGDNYSDEPNPLGGGGARIACGILR
ncbi:MAG: superoxide dismutase [Cu-Zn] SodC [Desulfovibrionaceae bacterium]|nr:superoxide dismutase [Cu-Zn] SodC [Desulfovibrionaceae bacterium]